MLDHRGHGGHGGRLAEINYVSGVTVDSAFHVHSALGPGLLESAYERCLVCELIHRGLEVRSQVPLPVTYRNVHIDIGYKIDLLVQGAVVVELKAVSRLAPIHSAQLLSYLKLSGYHVGLLINFNELHLKDGIKRLKNGF